jgi:hypothetical protein
MNDSAPALNARARANRNYLPMVFDLDPSVLQRTAESRALPHERDARAHT